MTDPIATLRAYIDRTDHPALPSALDALAELERRARIEARRDARRDAWLDSCHVVEIRHFTDVGMHLIHLVGLGGQRLASASGPDYHTALERALDAAGAP